MEVSALRYSGGIGLHARSPLLRLQSDERLVTLIRRGSTPAFEVLVSRYHARLLAFCRHLLGSREDAEDVLQEVFSAAFNAMLDDDRPINVRPWLYRIARNRSLNHLRRIQAVGVDSMDIHLSEHGATTADKVHEREEFRLLVGDIQGLPETQRTALVLREMDALSYEQISEAMETTVPSVKSLLVRARVSLAEAAEARLLSCEQVRIELAEVAEGLQRRPGALVRRHVRTCDRCSTFKGQLNETSKALTAVLPVGGFVLLRKLAILHLGHSAGAGAGSSASGASAAGQAAAVGGTAAAGAGAVLGSTTTGFLSASVGAIATKAAAGLAAAALVTAGAVEVEQPARPHVHHRAAAAATTRPLPPQPAACRHDRDPGAGLPRRRRASRRRGHASAQAGCGQGLVGHAQIGGQDTDQARRAPPPPRRPRRPRRRRRLPGPDTDPDRPDGARGVGSSYDDDSDDHHGLPRDQLGQHGAGELDPAVDDDGSAQSTDTPTTTTTTSTTDTTSTEPSTTTTSPSTTPGTSTDPGTGSSCAGDSRRATGHESGSSGSSGSSTGAGSGSTSSSGSTRARARGRRARRSPPRPEAPRPRVHRRDRRRPVPSR